MVIVITKKPQCKECPGLKAENQRLRDWQSDTAHQAGKFADRNLFLEYDNKRRGVENKKLWDELENAIEYWEAYTQDQEWMAPHEKLSQEKARAVLAESTGSQG